MSSQARFFMPTTEDNELLERISMGLGSVVFATEAVLIDEPVAKIIAHTELMATIYKSCDDEFEYRKCRACPTCGHVPTREDIKGRRPA